MMNQGLLLNLLWAILFSFGPGKHKVYAQNLTQDTAILLQKITEAQEIENNDPEQAKAIYLSVKTQSEKMNWTLGILKFYTNYSAVLNQQGRYDSALLLNLESVSLAKNFGDDYYIVATLMNTGVSYTYLNNPEAAIEYFLKALPLAKRNGNSNTNGILFDNLGNTFDAINNYSEAKKYYRKAINLYKQTGDTVGLCYTYNNLGKTLTSQGHFDSALVLIKEGIYLSQQVKSDYLAMIFQLALTNIFLHKGEYEAMISPGHQARVLSNTLNDLGSKANACYALSWAHLFKGQTDSAWYYGQMGLEAARQSGSVKEQSEMLDVLSQIALFKKDLKNFDYYRKQSDVFTDSLLNENIQNSTLTLAAKYEAGKKETAIAMLQKDTRVKRTWNFVLAGALLLGLTLIWLIMRNDRQRQRLAVQETALQQARIEELEKEKQLLAGQSLLRGQEEERTRLSRELHDGVGSMLSGIKFSLGAMKGNMVLAEKDAQLFTGTLQKLDETIAEMRRVAHSMMPEALLRLGLNAAISDYCDSVQASGKITVRYQQFGMDKRLPNDMEIIIYRIVQELFTNVLKHAEATEVILQLMQNDGILSLTFEDNGKGMNVSDSLLSAGAGLGNIRARVEYLRGQFDLRSSISEGTSAHIEIPLSK